MKIFFYLSLLFFASCAWIKVDPEKAKAVAENYLTDQKNERYDNINDYFTASFNESEPLEQKIEKLKQIKDVLGAIESFELSDTKVTERGLDDPSTVQLTYKVKYARGTAEQIFIIMNDEARHKITFMNVVTVAPPVLENN
jgi:hypothetical protein